MRLVTGLDFASDVSKLTYVTESPPISKRSGSAVRSAPSEWASDELSRGAKDWRASFPTPNRSRKLLPLAGTARKARVCGAANAKALVELSGTNENILSDPFCGTRFFQSILESGIYSIVTNADKTEEIDTSFFTDSVDLTEDFIGVPPKFKNCVRILSTKNWYGSRSLTIEMDQNMGIVQAYFI